MKNYYYDIHVFISRQDGYSITLKSDEPLEEDDAIERAAEANLFTEDGDQNHVDYVEEISEEEYNLLTLK